VSRREEYDAAVAAFIRTKGVTRCPTAYALPTEGTVTTADRAALKAYAVKRERSRQRKIAAHAHLFAAAGVTRSADE
jgi:hypothetical protein